MSTKRDLMLKQCVELGEAIGEQDWDQAKRRLAKLVEIIVGESKRSSADERREITGRSTYSRSSGFGNSGFSGGCTLAAA